MPSRTANTIVDLLLDHPNGAARLSRVRFGRLLLLSILLLLSANIARGAEIDPLKKYAWSETAGWINLRPTHAMVEVFDETMEPSFRTSSICR